MTIPEIHAYMRGNNGGRARSFEVDGVRVLVEANEDDDRGRAVAEHLASAHDVIEKLRTELAELRSATPPKPPVRTLGPGVVRFRRDELWLLNRAETGWASFGVCVRSWDELFRRYDVRVTEHGRDSTGEFWRVEPCTVLSNGEVKETRSQ